MQTVPHPVKTKSTSVRYWYMDTLRAYLMLGGVFYHAAMVYAPHMRWRLRDPETTNAIFDIVVLVLTSFRMSAFFLIAGFFCSMLFLRDAPGNVMRRRLVALGLPFLTMVLSFQLAQYALMLLYANQFPPASWRGFFSAYLLTGAFVGHLWFLLNLIVYYLAATWILSNSFLRGQAEKLLRHPMLLNSLPHKLVWAIGASGAMIVLDHIIGNWSIGTGYDLDTVFRYLPFFAIGTLVYLDTAFLDAFLTTRIVDWVAFAAAVVIRQAWPHSGPLTAISGEMAYYLAGFLLTVQLLRFSRKYMNKRSDTQQKLVDAAFSIYLFHHLCVVAAAMALIHFAPALNVFLKYAIVVSFAFLLPYAFHANLIGRFPRMRILFNGRSRTTSA